MPTCMLKEYEWMNVHWCFVSKVVSNLRWLHCCIFILDAGVAQTQWNLGRYQTKANLFSAIRALPQITTPRNNITGCIRILRKEVLAFGYRGHENWIQKVALIFVDQRAPNRRDLEIAYQVFNQWSHFSKTSGVDPSPPISFPLPPIPPPPP